MSVRVIVVGAGVVGLFCATRLAQRGCAVTLLEGEAEEFSVYGPTASASAAGMLAPLGEGDASAFDKLALASFDLWKTWRDGSLWADGVRFGGGAHVSGDPSGLIAKAQTLGRAAAPLTVSQWRKRTGFDTRVENTVFVEDEGVADPYRVLTGLCMEARRHGALLNFGKDVWSVSVTRAVLHSDAVFEADHVVLAPGAWATEELVQAAPALRHVRPGKGVLLPVELKQPLDPNIQAPGFYLARRMENDVVLGTTMELGVCTRQIDPAQVAELLATAEKLLPGEVTQRGKAWTGIRPMSPDGMPMVGRSGEVLVACGHARNGWLFAPLTAEIICAHVLGEPLAPDWAAFDPHRFD